MQKVIGILGWALAFAFGAAAIFLVVMLLDSNQKLDTQRAKKEHLMAQVETLTGQVASLEVDLETAKAEAEANSPAGGMTSALEALQGMAGGGDGQAIPEEMFQAWAEGMEGMQADGGDEPGNFMEAAAQMFKGEQGKELAKMSAGMQVDMMYGDFIRALELTPEQADQVRDIFRDNLAEQMIAGLELMEGDFDPEQMKNLTNGLETQLKEQLSEVLSPDQVAYFDTYKEEMPARMLDKQYEQQMVIFAPDLTEENRKVVREVLVEEMMLQGYDLDAMEDLGNFGSVADMQRGAFDRTRERVAEFLGPEQLAEYDKFTKQQLDMFETLTSLYGVDKKAEEGRETPATP